MLSFHRQINIALKTKKPLSNQRQGLSFFLSVGVAGEVDPLTGMSFDLTLLDNFLREEKQALQAQKFSNSQVSVPQVLKEMGEEFRSRLEKKLGAANGQLASLEINEVNENSKLSWSSERGWTLRSSMSIEVLNYFGRYNTLKLFVETESLEQGELQIPVQYQGLAELMGVLKKDFPQGTLLHLQSQSSSEQWTLQV